MKMAMAMAMKGVGPRQKAWEWKDDRKRNPPDNEKVGFLARSLAVRLHERATLAVSAACSTTGDSRLLIIVA